MNTADEEVMWLRLKDAQREAETRRLLKEARRVSARGRRESRPRLPRWLARLAS